MRTRENAFLIRAHAMRTDEKGIPAPVNDIPARVNFTHLHGNNLP
jgi:hypothetical protein